MTEWVEPQPVTQDTICDDCGKLVRHNVAHWMDDGASYCPSCRPLPATPSSAVTVSVEAAIQLAQKFACEDVGFEIALRALAGEGER